MSPTVFGKQQREQVQPRSRKDVVPERPAEIALEEPYCSMAKWTAFRSPFQKVKLDDPLERQIAAVGGTVGGLQELSCAVNELVDGAMTANIQVDVDEHNRTKAEALVARVKQELQIPRFQFASPDILSWDLADLPYRERYTYFGRQIWASIQGFYRSFERYMLDMVDSNFFGLLEWKKNAPGWCRYHYYRVSISQRKQRTKERSTTEKKEYHERNYWEEVRTTSTTHTHRRSLYYEWNEHQVYDGRLHRLPAKQVEQPSRVENFIHGIHPTLQPFMGVVAGGMLREHIKSHCKWQKELDETEVTKEIIRRGQLISPAVVLSNVVLVGWSGMDVEEDRSRRWHSLLKKLPLLRRR